MSKPTAPLEPDLRVKVAFLVKVWELQPDGEFFLATKDWTNDHWAEHPAGRTPARLLNTDAIGENDLYFSPSSFTEKRRLRKHAQGGRWLFADLDEVDPRKLDILPHIAWETSPGRFQCLWLLDRTVKPRTLEKLNQKMTYYTGADKGGWSLTKVLRVPGSLSNKYSTPHRVRLIRIPGAPTEPLSVSDLSTILRDVSTDASAEGAPQLPDDLPSVKTVKRRYRGKIPARARQLMNTRTVLKSDDRSARLWELANLLANAGLTRPAIFVLLKDSPWNKYRGQRREDRMLWQEACKVTTPQSPTATKEKRKKRRRNKNLLPNTLGWDDFMHREWPKPTWLVEDVWTEGAYGIMAGEYKAFKTMLLLDLAISVASGKSFLGSYTVRKPGTVCYIHEEGRPWSIHDRLTRIAASKGLLDTYSPTDDVLSFTGKSLPLHVTSLPGLNLTDPDDQEAVERHVKAMRPRLVILETFYLLSGGVDEVKQAEVTPILEYLARLSHEYGTSLILSHHFHKSREDKRFLDRVSGSGVFLRWYESGMFIERVGKEEENKIQLLAAHRDGGTKRQHLQLLWDSDDESSYVVNFLEDIEDPTEDPDPEIQLTPRAEAKRRRGQARKKK